MGFERSFSAACEKSAEDGFRTFILGSLRKIAEMDSNVHSRRLAKI